MKAFFISLICALLFTQAVAQAPVRVAGLSHGHANWNFSSADKKDLVLVRTYEPNKELADRYARRYMHEQRLFSGDRSKMLDQVKP